MKNAIIKSHCLKSRSQVYDFLMTLPKANYQKDGLIIQRQL